ncbi:MAG: hypothetical protein AAF512_07170 [Pseudomonadota bacterium]
MSFAITRPIVTARLPHQPLALAVSALLALGGQPVSAATINVTGGCNLVDAITAANTDAAVGGCPTGDTGTDTIVLTSNDTITLTTVNNMSDGNNGLPSITSPIIINGNNATILRSGMTAFRIFQVARAGSRSADGDRAGLLRCASPRPANAVAAAPGSAARCRSPY